MQQDHPQQADIAYAAGFFDGEGSIAYYVGSGKNRKGIVFAASAYQKNREVLDWMKSVFGGGVYLKSNNQHEWRATGHGAASFLNLVRPHLKVKHIKADEALGKWNSRAAAQTE